MSYLTSILSSKVYEVAFESPLQYAPKISQRSGVRILLKREDLQPVSIFITIELIISVCFFYSSNVDLWVGLLLIFYKKNVDIRVSLQAHVYQLCKMVTLCTSYAKW